MWHTLSAHQELWFFHFSVWFPWANVLPNWVSSSLQPFLLLDVIHINTSCDNSFSYFFWSTRCKGKLGGTCGVAVEISKFILSTVASLSREQPFLAVSLGLGLSVWYSILLSVLGGKLLQSPYVWGMNVSFVNQQSHRKNLALWYWTKASVPMWRSVVPLFGGVYLIQCNVNNLTVQFVLCFIIALTAHLKSAFRERCFFTQSPNHRCYVTGAEINCWYSLFAKCEFTIWKLNQQLSYFIDI